MNSLQAVFDFVLRSSLEATAIVGLILLLQALLRRRLGARWHYALWLVLVARMFMPWTPESPASLFALVPQPSAPDLIKGASGFFAAVPTYTQLLELEAPVPTGDPNESSAPLPVDSPYPIPTVAVLWLSGAFLLGTYFLFVNLHFTRKLRAEPVLHDPEINELLSECGRQLSLRTSVQIIATSLVASPTLFGYVSPRILLPQSFIGDKNLSALRYVLMHELAHVKRHDILMTWLTTFLQTLHWFNPVVWFAFYRMRLDREPACDALTLSYLEQDEAGVYGNTLLDLVKVKQNMPVVRGTVGIMEHKTQIARRITLIAAHTARAYRWSPFVGALFALVMALTLTNAPTISAQPENAPTATPEQRPAQVEPTLQTNVDNAAELYLRALKDVVPIRDREGADELSEFDKFLKGAYNAALFDPVVARNEATLDLLLQAAQLEKCDFAAVAEGPGLKQLSDGAGVRDLYRVGTLAVARALNRNNGERALDLYLAILAMGERLHQRTVGGLMASLINNAGLSIIQSRTSSVLRQIATSPELVEKMATQVRALRTTLGDWTTAVEGEAAMTAAHFPAPRTVATYDDLEDFQALANIGFTEPEAALGTPPVQSPLASLMRGENTPENRDGAARQLGCVADDLSTAQGIADAIIRYGTRRSEFWQEIIRLLKLPYPDAIANLDALQGATETQGSANDEPSDHGVGATVLSSQANVQARLGLTQTAIAIVQFHASKGRLPEALSELEEAEIVLDPFTAKLPFNYEVAGEKSFKLQSKGSTSSPAKGLPHRTSPPPSLSVSF